MEHNAMAVTQMNWAQSIRAASESGMSEKDWCAVHGVCRSTFYRWKRVLKDKIINEACPSSLPDFARLQLPANFSGVGDALSTLVLRAEGVALGAAPGLQRRAASQGIAGGAPCWVTYQKWRASTWPAGIPICGTSTWKTAAAFSGRAPHRSCGS